MYTKEQLQRLACDWCDSWPCVCEALGIGRALLKKQRDHRKARPVSVDSANINATYAASLRTGERHIATAPTKEVHLRRKRKGKWC